MAIPITIEKLLTENVVEWERLGYSGNASKTFRNSIEELIVEEKIHYSSENAQDSNNVLIKD